MKYTVYVTSHRYGFVEVKAKSTEEAKQKAINKALKNDAHWIDRDITVSDCMLEDDEAD